VLNIHVYPSTFEYETRILKVTETLVSSGIVNRILVIAKAGNGLPCLGAIDSKRSVMRVNAYMPGEIFLSKSLRFVEWSLRVWWLLRKDSITLVNCHSLSVLPLCVGLKFWHGASLVYEPHELETETGTFTGKKKLFAKWLEGMLIGQAIKVIVVSDSISAHYRKNYGILEVPVVLNAPKLELLANSDRYVLRKRFNIPEQHLIFIYQGVLEVERGILELIQAFQAVSCEKHLVLMGFGSLTSVVKKASEKYPNIHLLPAVKPSEVMYYTRGADVGFALLENSCENHRCALQNKLFHYLHAGLPVVVSDLHEMGKIIDRYACGWRVDNNVMAISSQVNAINKSDLKHAAFGTVRARTELNWEIESIKLRAIYKQIFHKRIP
jgi:glycosyltransferase involved in cell wall biosynthesis